MWHSEHHRRANTAKRAVSTHTVIAGVKNHENKLQKQMNMVLVTGDKIKE